MIANGRGKLFRASFFLDHVQYFRRARLDEMGFGQCCIRSWDVIVRLKATFHVTGLDIRLACSHTETETFIILIIFERRHRPRVRDFAHVYFVDLIVDFLYKDLVPQHCQRIGRSL